MSDTDQYINGIEPFRAAGTVPAIVSVSDVHGYLDECRSALLAVGDSDRFQPVVTVDTDGLLHWAGNDYVLVFNGDLVDRGDNNQETLDMARRLASEAPDGRVQYLLGNHEMAILLPSVLSWPDTFSYELARPQRQQFISDVATGAIAAAFEGYTYTYSHAGAQNGIQTERVNAQLRKAGCELLAGMDQERYETVQERMPHRYASIFGTDGGSGRGPEAGLLWMDFAHMPEHAPPQVVGHTRQQTPTRLGNTVCENVIRRNQYSPGGEAVLVETPDKLEAVSRRPTGDVAVSCISGSST